MRTVKWHDVSVPIRDGMVHWPSDPAVSIKRVADVELGDSHTLSELNMGSHTGTHMDAPLHFLPGKAGIDQLPLEIVIGTARVIEIKDEKTITAEELSHYRIRRGDRVLFKTRNSQLWGSGAFVEDFVYLADDGAEYLVTRGVALVGVDYLSVGGYKANGAAVHRALLSHGIWLIEGLDLSGVRAGKYEMVCLPLRLVKADGAPARVVIRHVPR